MPAKNIQDCIIIRLTPSYCQKINKFRRNLVTFDIYSIIIIIESNIL